MEILDVYRRAGEIAREVRKRAGTIVHENTRVIELCEKLESLIIELGGRPAFPCNVCIDEVAAHYSSPPDDGSVIPPNSMVKVDIGVHVDGYIVDTAVTVALDPSFADMVRVVEEALREGVRKMRAGVQIHTVSKAIQDRIEFGGYKPVWNLTGHKIERYCLHTGKSIPNVVGQRAGELKEGEIYALEPFITETTSRGEVVETDERYIFRFSKSRPSKSPEVKELLDWVRREYDGLPFALRWLPRSYLPAFQGLVSSKAIKAYPVLVEATNGVVAQAEHTVMVTKKGCVVLT